MLVKSQRYYPLTEITRKSDALFEKYISEQTVFHTEMRVFKNVNKKYRIKAAKKKELSTALDGFNKRFGERSHKKYVNIEVEKGSYGNYIFSFKKDLKELIGNLNIDTGKKEICFYKQKADILPIEQYGNDNRDDADALLQSKYFTLDSSFQSVAYIDVESDPFNLLYQFVILENILADLEAHMVRLTQYREPFEEYHLFQSDIGGTALWSNEYKIIEVRNDSTLLSHCRKGSIYLSKALSAQVYIKMEDIDEILAAARIVNAKNTIEGVPLVQNGEVVDYIAPGTKIDVNTDFLDSLRENTPLLCTRNGKSSTFLPSNIEDFF